MASGSEIVGTAAGAAGIVPALIGRGKNNRTAGNFGDSKQFDPNAGLWAGQAGASDAYAARYQGQAQNWQNKANEYGAQQQGLYNGGQASMQQQQDARGMQMDAAGMARARATGAVPSIAQQQTDRGMAQVGQQAAMARQQAVAQQASQAASARGAAGLALAGQGAANNVANASQNITQGQMAQQADMARAGAVAASQERLAAEQAYAQQSGAIRGGDQSAAQTSFGAAAQAGQLGLGAGQLGATYGQMDNDVRKAEMQGKAQQQATLAQSYGQSESLNQQTANQNAEKKGLIETVGDFFSDGRTKLYMGGAPAMAEASSDVLANGGGMDVNATIAKHAAVGTAFVSDPTGGAVAGMRADGGPVAAGQPYVVGERGPEIVVPGADGTVIPNHAISTWGSGGPDVAAQDEAAAQAGVQANNATFAAQEAGAWKNGYQRDLDEIQGQRKVSRMLGQDARLTDDDKRKERAAKFMLNAPPGKALTDAQFGGESDPEEKAKVVAGEAVPKFSWATALGTLGKNLNEAQFGPPRRADGGPVKAGQPYMMGERGPEVVLPLSNPDGYELRQSEDGRGYYERAQDMPTMVPARFAGGLQSGGRKTEAPKPKAKAKGGALDLDKAAAELERSTKQEWAARLAQGPAVRPADALAGAPYVYKDEFRPPEQAPGEVNYGPTAQTMEQNPVTATAVKRDPATGLLSVDANKLAKVNSTAIADLQKQIDEIALNAGGRR